MRLTVLGACGAWPAAGQACSGYLVEHDGFRLLVDVGYATVPRLFERVAPHEVDAVFVSHGHPDHCADLNPLLRARAMSETRRSSALPVHALPGALDPVLALDRPGMLAAAIDLHELDVGRAFEIGPFRAETWSLPHFVPNAGVRLSAGDAVLAYTGDTGPSPDVVALARNADLLLAEATHVNAVPADSSRYLSTAAEAGCYAAQASAGRLLLTHLWPEDDPEVARERAATEYDGPVGVATIDLVVDLS